jgi:secreted Zn-dependent insulinase-like peptidase
VTFSEFKSFAASFLDNFRFTAFITGNIFQDEAEDIIMSMKVLK